MNCVDIARPGDPPDGGPTMKRPRLGLALGSGSARGRAHIGVNQARLENGFDPDVVCGTSIGSLVDAVYVAGRLYDLRGWAGSRDVA